MSHPGLTDPGAMARRLGIEIVEASAQRVVGTMPVEGNTQPYGLLNGGASLALVETLGSIGAHLHAGAGRGAVGIEINASHHRSARGGLVTGVATPVNLGQTLAVYEVVVRDERGARLCTARLTCMLRDLPGLQESRGQSSPVRER
jgi:1,4-dihydroxy-2-naphthoyl-CoA hydrolase